MKSNEGDIARFSRFAGAIQKVQRKLNLIDLMERFATSIWFRYSRERVLESRCHKLEHLSELGLS